MAERAHAIALVALLAAAGAGGAPVDGDGPFVERAAERGLEFRHYNGRSGHRYILEITGSGAALFDFDGDGDLDAYFPQGGPLPGAATPTDAPRNRLFRNDGSGRFSPVPDDAGLGDERFSMGAAVGDIDGDGDPDVLVTNFGPDALYINEGGRFRDVAEQAGVADPRWTSSAAFFDMDGDGDLDLYVAAYLDFAPERQKPCALRGHPVHCGPDSYDGLADRVYENDGSGRFRDVSAESGVADHVGKGLGVVAGDFDGDGDADVYVANDGTANFLFINETRAGKPAFREEALFYGAAYGQTARAEAGMGTDMGDYDGDGDPDIVVTNLDAQTNSIYRNDGGDGTTESSVAAGLGAATLPWVGFGVRFVDYDLDGRLDLVVTNGHIMDNVGVVREGARFAQPNLLFRNVGGRFEEECASCLPVGVGRGLASGDVDGDGDEDVLISNNDGAPYLLLNRAPKRGRAVGLRLEGRGGSNRDAYGARVSWRVDGETRVREVRAAASFCSSSDPRLLLAIPDADALAEVSVRWPDGDEETVRLAPGAYHHVIQGEGAVASTPFAAPAPDGSDP